MSSGSEKSKPTRRQFLTDKFVQNGLTLDGMSEEDLICYVLSCCGKNADRLSETMPANFGTLRGLLAASPADLYGAGITDTRTVSKIKLVNEVMISAEIQKLGKSVLFADEERVCRYLRLLFLNRYEETVYVIPLEKKTLGVPRLFAAGAETQVGLDAGKLVGLLKSMASCEEFIICHNHPNDTSEPSEMDIAATEQLFGVTSLNGYTLREHYVIGTDGVSKVPFSRNLLKYYFKT